MVGAAVLQHLGEILAELLTDKLQCCITLLGINVTNNKGECIENGDRTADVAKRKPCPNRELLNQCVIIIIY